MATWMVHCKIAEYFLDKIGNLSKEDFVIGNFAPDCGYGVKDSKGEFEPPPQVTHWSPSGEKRDCRYKEFEKEYLSDKKRNKSYSFYLGYYVHLLTDMMWSSQMYVCIMGKLNKDIEKDKDFLKVIKLDWNEIDKKLFFKDKNKIAYSIIDNAKNIGDYLPYYEKGQLAKQIKCIADNYKGEIKLSDRECKYLTGGMVDNFIECAAQIIEDELIRKELI